MEIKTHIDAILKKKMGRKDFIKHVALGLVVLSGAGSALQLMSGKQTKSDSSSYSGSIYGGAKSSRNSGGPS